MNIKQPLIIEASVAKAIAPVAGASCVQEWMLQNPDRVATLQQEFLQAGASLLCAPTGGTHFLGLADYEMGPAQARKLNLSLTALTQQAAEGAAVGGIISSAEHMPEPMGPIPFIDLVDLYAEQALELKEGGAQFLVLTGMTTLPDLRAAVLGARQSQLSIIALLQMEEVHGMEEYDADPLSAMICVQELGITAFGVSHPDATQVPAVLERLAPYAKVDLAAGLEAGLAVSPEELAPVCFEALEAGARIFISRRGMTPEHMLAVSSVLDTPDMEAFPFPERKRGGPLTLADGLRLYYLEQENAAIAELPCGPGIPEDILQAEDDGADLLLFRVRGLEDAQLLGQYAHMTHTAVGLIADQEEVLEMGLLYYQGRAVVDARSGIAPDILESLAAGYGAVIYDTRNLGDGQMALPYHVGKVWGAPNFDSLPVAKITHYPLEKWDYKPYAQTILCISGGALVLRMWAFEVSPQPSSSMRGVFYLFPELPDDALCVDIFSTGEVFASLLTKGRETGATVAEVTAQPFGGEDLQGVYWGVTVTIPLEQIKKLGHIEDLQAGLHFPGNFYKLCSQEPFVHSGSCFEADFTDNPYTRSSMGDMQVVAY